ncbi:ATP-binding cassette domain-containing protein [Streptococcus gordonii]|uniref:ATP-binding cassette domain-containing protein n=1 Tax=Streptococcus gordonii TaxID=1302 RepID=UPI001C64205B|nr:ABC transporter ATP-binding protein [Streptococcus gordonii]MBW7663725.1 ABC transporter ATP-binding protein/permease [Streptococcus gordonii]
MKILSILNKKNVILAILFSLLTGLDTLVVPVIVNGIIDSVQSKDISNLFYITLYGIVGYILLQLCLFLWKKYIAKVNCDFSQLAKYRTFTYAVHKNLPSEDAENIIYNDIPLLEKQYVEALLNFLYCIWFSMISLIYVLTISWQVSLIFILFSVIPLILPKFFEKQLKNSSVEWSKANEALIKEINENLHAVSVMKHYRRVSYFINRFLLKLNSREKSTYKKNKLSYRVTFIINSFAVISGILPFGLGGYLAIKGYLSIGELVAVFLASDRVLSPLENAINHWNDMRISVPIREKLEAILFDSAIEELVDEENSRSIEDVEIIFNNVNFGYTFPLFNLTDNLAKGDKVLIIGPSGAGKTTIYKTIFKEIDKLSGDIFINSQKIEDVKQSYIYANVGYIPQELVIFDDTLLFNLTLGEKFSSEEISNAIQQSGLQNLILRKGIEYKVGNNGEKLSGGEKARLIVARALLRQYSLILVDEFSSSLDNKTASKIRDVLLNTNATVIEIAHHYTEDDKCKYSKIWELAQ